MWISRDGRRIIEANDGGAPISIDGGKTWDWRFNVVLAQIYRVGYDEENPYHVCGGIQDNDSYCGPSDSLSPLGIENSDWRDVGNDGDGSWVWPQPGDPSSIWNVGVNELNGQLGIFDLRSRQNYDITPDVTDTNGRALAGLPYRSNWEAPIAFSGRQRPSTARTCCSKRKIAGVPGRSSVRISRATIPANSRSPADRSTPTSPAPSSTTRSSTSRRRDSSPGVSGPAATTGWCSSRPTPERIGAT